MELDPYFLELDAVAKEKLHRLPDLYADWNTRINVVSRKDVENLMERHILHSLAIAKVMPFQPGAKILDLGTGGGFPGIPLAIMFPEVSFTLVDSIGKKINVVKEIATALDLKNVEALHIRAEELRRPRAFDFVVTRAVAPLDKLLVWCQHLISTKHKHFLPNGILALKGGDLRSEISALPGRGKEYTELYPIKKYFQSEFFEEKYVVYLQG